MVGAFTLQQERLQFEPLEYLVTSLYGFGLFSWYAYIYIYIVLGFPPTVRTYVGFD